MSPSNRAQPDAAQSRPLGTTLTVDRLGLVQDLSFEVEHAGVFQEMAADWKRGTRTPAEQWLERYPHLSADAETAVRIIYEEVCLREECGEQVAPEEIQRRFPQWSDALRLLFDCHDWIESEYAEPIFPNEGEWLGELQMLRRLGRGAVGQVFLASQSSLSDRPVVVKLTPQTGDEHLSLARLQHTHIVPLYHVLDFPQQHLRALCMPYLGGLSWSELLHALKTESVERRTGRRIVELLEAAHASLPPAPQRSGPALSFLSRATPVQAVCWIGACLADALHYAHQCDLVHLDIKPSNVLIAGDGQPMLLDFHLAQQAIAANGAPPRRLGGTPGYMSPEQIVATQAVREGRPSPCPVDRLSDIFSLGVLLYESLTGQLPDGNEKLSRDGLRRLNPAAGRGLEDVIHKCLAPRAAERYGDAGQLAVDLRRHLADLSLLGVSNHSLSERWRKWRRRKPHALMTFSALAVTLLAIVSGGTLFVRDRLDRARQAVGHAREDFENHDYAAAVERLQSGSQAIAWFPGQYDLKQELKTQLMLSRRARLADTLHQLVEQLRLLDSFESVPDRQLRHLQLGCEQLWSVRTTLLEGDHATLSAAHEAQLHEDVLDLASLWTQMLLRFAPAAGQNETRARALAILDEAEALCGRSPVVELARGAIVDSAGTKRADNEQFIAAAHTAHEHLIVGRHLFRLGDLKAAQGEFEQAIDLEPDAFWPNFYETLCAYRQEQFEQALNSAQICIALAPKRAACYYNRALCQQALQHAKLAIADYTRALVLDPTLGRANLQRGILLAAAGQANDALADFATAAEQGVDPAVAHYQAALVRVGQHDWASALVSLKRALDHDVGYEPAAALLRQLNTGR
jgi:serine/threonine protein kinase